MITDYETTYQLEIARDDGLVLASLDMAGPFEYTRVANNYGPFSVQLPVTFDWRLVARDRRFVVWRRPASGAMTREYQGLIRFVTTSGLTQDRLIQGYDFNYLLSKRHVLYAADSAQSKKTDYADDMMKAIVAQNLGASASGSRVLNATYFSVAANVSAGPSISLAFAYRNMLDVLIDIGQAARLAGTDVYFDMDAVDNSAIQFRTYIKQRGTDRTATTGVNPVIFSVDAGNLINPVLEEDGTDEANAVTVLGQGDGAARSTVTRTDATRTGLSLWSYAERAIDRRDLTATASLNAAGDAGLIDGRIKNRFTGTILSIPNSLYGVHWFYGDKVTINYAGRQFDALIRAVHVKVDENRRETIDAVLEAYL